MNHVYETTEWKVLRNRVLEEADYICLVCGGVASTAHHVYYTDNFWNKDLLVPLCWSCHENTHGGIWEFNPKGYCERCNTPCCMFVDEEHGWTFDPSQDPSRCYCTWQAESDSQ